MDRAEVTALNMGGNGIEPADAVGWVKVLRKHPNVTTLDLSKNKLGDAGCDRRLDTV